jgi:hypothetical protein
MAEYVICECGEIESDPFIASTEDFVLNTSLI